MKTRFDRFFLSALGALLAVFVIGTALPHAHDHQAPSGQTPACHVCAVQRQSPAGPAQRPAFALPAPGVVATLASLRPAAARKAITARPSSRAPPVIS